MIVFCSSVTMAEANVPSRTMHRQKYMLTRSTSTQKYSTRFENFMGLLDHFTYMVQEEDNVCAWNGISCTGGLVTSIHAEFPGGDPGSHILRWAILMEWIPPTLNSIHFDRICLIHGWAAEKLPRDLRYMFLSNCDSAGTASGVVADFRKLPLQMEEMIVITSWFNGKLDLSALPKNMTLLYIRTDPSNLDTVYVDYGLLPRALQNLHITDKHQAKRIQVRRTGHTRADSRVKTRFDPNMPACASKYMAEFIKQK